MRFVSASSWLVLSQTLLAQSFDPVQSIPTQSDLILDPIVQDFDLDGHDDLVVVHAKADASAPTVEVIMLTPSGSTSQTQTTIASLSHQNIFAAAMDINQDRYPEIVVIKSNLDVEVFPNHRGMLQRAVALNRPFRAPYQRSFRFVALGGVHEDLDQDGRDELIIALFRFDAVRGYVGMGVEVLTSFETPQSLYPTFQVSQTQTIGLSSLLAVDLRLADLIPGGNEELVSLEWMGNDTYLSVFTRNGTTWSLSDRYPVDQTGRRARSFDVADIDLDGDLDIAIGYLGGLAIDVLESPVAGASLNQHIVHQTLGSLRQDAEGVVAVRLRDANRDGDVDLLVRYVAWPDQQSELRDHQVGLLVNGAAGFFSRIVQDVSIGQVGELFPMTPNGLAWGDVNLDAVSEPVFRYSPTGANYDVGFTANRRSGNYFMAIEGVAGPGSCGTPTIEFVGGVPFIGNRTFGLRVRGLCASTPGLEVPVTLLFSSFPSNVVIHQSAGHQYVMQVVPLRDLHDVGFADHRGEFYSPTPIPDRPALVGAEVCAQALAFDNGTGSRSPSPIGAVLSRRARVIIGTKQ